MHLNTFPMRLALVRNLEALTQLHSVLRDQMRSIVREHCATCLMALDVDRPSFALLLLVYASFPLTYWIDHLADQAAIDIPRSRFCCSSSEVDPHCAAPCNTDVLFNMSVGIYM